MRPFSTVTSPVFCRKTRCTVCPIGNRHAFAQNKSALEFLVSKGTRALKDRSGSFPLNRYALAPRGNTHSQFAFRTNDPWISGFPDSLRDFCSQSVATGRIGRVTSWPAAADCFIAAQAQTGRFPSAALYIVGSDDCMNLQRKEARLCVGSP